MIEPMTPADWLDTVRGINLGGIASGRATFEKELDHGRRTE